MITKREREDMLKRDLLDLAQSPSQEAAVTLRSALTDAARVIGNLQETVDYLIRHSSDPTDKEGLR